VRPDPERVRSACAGKAKHSPTRAKQIARDMRRRHGETAIDAYHCPHCGGWHVGSSQPMPDERRKNMEKTTTQRGHYGSNEA
jgi:hypothetical protein